MSSKPPIVLVHDLKTEFIDAITAELALGEPLTPDDDRLMVKRLDTPLLDAARQRHAEFEAHLKSLPPATWWQRLQMRWYFWRHGI